MDLDWLVEIGEPTKGAPRTTYKMNPRIWEMPTQGTDKTDRSPHDPLLSVLSVGDPGHSKFSTVDDQLKTDEANGLFHEASEMESTEEIARWTA